ncbi:MAG: hypothetical protein U5L76_02200 [Patescibacteria group bacterium]|nr:hypothetical protein [Patescibacteria group bacterium]
MNKNNSRLLKLFFLVTLCLLITLFNFQEAKAFVFGSYQNIRKFNNLIDTPASYNSGRLLFEDSDSVTDSANLFWDNSNQYLSVGGASASNTLDIHGGIDSDTLNTGQGDYELYAMNQDVETTDNVTFNDLTISSPLNIYALSHNSFTGLPGLQGGTTNEYYHLTSAEYSGYNNTNWDNAYDHSQDNTQAHSDYLLNTGDTATGDYTFDTNTFHIDATNNKVGVGTTSPAASLHVVKSGGTATDSIITVESTSSLINPQIRFINDEDVTAQFIMSRSPSSTAGQFMIRQQSSSDDIVFEVGSNLEVARFTNNMVGIGTSSPSYVLDVKGRKSIGSATITGSGLDDMSTSGTFTGSATTNYRVQIDGLGDPFLKTPDTFKWSDDGGSTWDATTVDITGSTQSLNNGVRITFGATTGHDLGDYWDFTATVIDPFSVQSASGTNLFHVGNDGAVTRRELSADPSDPDEGSHVIWQSDGTGTGDDGDIMMKITAGGTTKTTTLVDFSAI